MSRKRENLNATGIQSFELLKGRKNPSKNELKKFNKTFVIYYHNFEKVPQM